jgi:hypothetical protein
MWLAKWSVFAVALAVVLGGVKNVRAEERLTPEQMIAKADAVVKKAQDLQDRALEALRAARASGDPSAIADANNVLTTIKGVLKKAERDNTALKEALANGNLEDAAAIFEGIGVALEALGAAEGALASVGGAGFDASVGGDETLDVDADGNQPGLDNDDAGDDYLDEYDDGTKDRAGYTSDSGGVTGGKNTDSATSSGDDLVAGSPTGSALD